MEPPKVSTTEVNGFKVICIGEPDFNKLPQDKIDRHLKWCMESLRRYYGDRKGVTAKNEDHTD